MERIVLFDGVCNFCNGTVNFIIRHDPASHFRFAALQYEAGERLRREYNIDDEIDSVILIESGRAFTHSDAALRIARGLGGIWGLGYIFVVVPRFIRDGVYKLFAQNRYRLFGRRDECMMPTPEERERFLD